MKKKLTVAISVALASFALTCNARDLPDPNLTPGATNPNVTQQNIESTVCVRGFSKTIRPPVTYTNKLKRQQIEEYGYANADPRDYEEDHLIPLSIGGNPTDRRNLWPQPRHTQWGAERKDELEFALYKAVCSGEIGLEEAQQAIATDWVEAYRHYHYLLNRYRQGTAD